MDDCTNVKESPVKRVRKPVHGGAQAVKAITRGAEFTGVPEMRETEVRKELADQGRPAIVERNAVRLQTAADLYFDATVKAMQDGDMYKADGYIKVYGWLASAALRAWGAVQVEEKDAAKGSGAGVIDVLDSIRRSKDNGKTD